MEYNNPLKEYQDRIKAMQGFQNPLKEYQDKLKDMQKLHNPLKEYQDKLKSMQGLHNPLKEYQDRLKDIQRLHNPLKEYQDKLKAMQGLHNPLKEYQDKLKSMEKLHNPFEAYQDKIKLMQGLRSPFKEYQDTLKSIKGLNNVIDTLSQNKWLINDKDFHVEDGNISIGEHSVGQQELQNIADKIISNSFDKNQNIEEQMERLILEISALKDPAIQKVLAWFLNTIIIGLMFAVVNSATDYYIKKELNNNEKKVLVKKVSKVITTEIDRKMLSTFKIVSAGTLNVREAGANKSQIIGQLYLGYVVNVVEKGRKWSLVQWKSENEKNVIQGWGFSRYLKAIK